PGICLIALSCFTATENLHILEMDCLHIRIRLVVNEYSLVIGKLVRHELQHMRRGLLQRCRGQKGQTPEAQTGPQELDRLQGLLRLCQAMSSINGSLEMSIQVCESDTLVPVYLVFLSRSSVASNPAATTTEGGEEGDRFCRDNQIPDRVIGT
ncbi:MAG: hypothetical protein J3Q66DRAFT_362433, partial [Benniella sp.]